MFAPLIWNKRKLEAMGLNSKYTALLTMASVTVLTLPLFLLTFLKAIRL